MWWKVLPPSRPAIRGATKMHQIEHVTPSLDSGWLGVGPRPAPPPVAVDVAEPPVAEPEPERSILHFVASLDSLRSGPSSVALGLPPGMVRTPFSSLPTFFLEINPHVCGFSC